MRQIENILQLRVVPEQQGVESCSNSLSVFKQDWVAGLEDGDCTGAKSHASDIWN
jgi:hypothetical protein